MDRRAFLSAAAACSVLSASGQQYARAQSMPRFYEAARYSSERNGVSFLVVRNGVVLGEDYPSGSPNARWHVGAGTRMFTPLLAATLAEARLLNLDEPVSATLVEWALDERKASIPLRSLLNGTSGLAFARRGERTLNAALAMEPHEVMGQSYSDDETAYLLFTEIARRKLVAANAESDPARWLTTRTLLPIGCVPIGWTRASDGAARFDDGAAVSGRGWAQAGELIRREGVWRASQIADSAVLQEARRGTFAEPRAGMGLWLAGQGRGQAPIESDLWRVSNPAPPDMVMAAGAGGQRLYIAPSAGLVITRQSRETSGAWSDAQFLTLVWRDL